MKPPLPQPSLGKVEWSGQRRRKVHRTLFRLFPSLGANKKGRREGVERGGRKYLLALFYFKMKKSPEGYFAGCMHKKLDVSLLKGDEGLRRCPDIFFKKNLLTEGAFAQYDCARNILCSLRTGHKTKPQF